MQHVMFGVPHLGDLPGYFVDSFVGELVRVAGTPGRSARYLRAQNLPVDVARNKLVAAALANPDVTHVMFMDADMAFPAGAVNRLLDRRKPIVGGLYFRRDALAPFPQLWQRTDQEEQGLPYYRAMAEEYEAWLQRSGQAVVPTGEQVALIETDDVDDQLMEVDSTGGGCLLVAREVFEAIGSGPWFVAHDYEIGRGGGEDHFFAELARAAGYSVFVDLTVQCGHEGRGTLIGRDNFLSCLVVAEPAPALEPSAV